MFCPRCGRPVSDTANFCGGCGLPRAEIEKMNSAKSARMTTPVIPKAPQIDPIDRKDLSREIDKLTDDLTGANPVNDYTTNSTDDTNGIVTPGDFIQNEIREEAEKTAENSYYNQSRYSYNRPKHPEYTENTNREYNFVETEIEKEVEGPLSVVDYIWMMILSSLPFIGIFYLLWLAFIQKDSIGKRNFARAMVIMAAFSILLGVVFAMGLIVTQVAHFY